MWGRKNFYFGDNISVGVRDLDGAIAWYEEKLGLKLTPLKSEDFDAFLAFGKKDEIGLALCLIPPGQTTANVEGHPILFSKTIEAAYEDPRPRALTSSPSNPIPAGTNSFASAIWSKT